MLSTWKTYWCNHTIVSSPNFISLFILEEYINWWDVSEIPPGTPYHFLVPCYSCCCVALPDKLSGVTFAFPGLWFFFVITAGTFLAPLEGLPQPSTVRDFPLSSVPMIASWLSGSTFHAIYWSNFWCVTGVLVGGLSILLCTCSFYIV